MDYEETYSAVIRIGSVFFVFAVVSIFGLFVVLDKVPNAYVKGTIKEKVYMNPLPELELPQEKVLRLLKPLYSLKKFGRCWNDRINNYLESIQFRRCSFGPFVYVLHAEDGYVLLGLYVDDILMARSTQDIMKRVTQLLFDRYEIKFSSAEKFMGMNIKDNSRFFYFSQPRMVEELLVCFNMEYCKPVKT